MELRRLKWAGPKRKSARMVVLAKHGVPGRSNRVHGFHAGEVPPALVSGLELEPSAFITQAFKKLGALLPSSATSETNARLAPSGDHPRGSAPKTLKLE